MKEKESLFQLSDLGNTKFQSAAITTEGWEWLNRVRTAGWKNVISRETTTIRSFPPRGSGGGCTLLRRLASEGLNVVVLLKRTLGHRPHCDIACVTYDWVHTVLQYGVLNVEVERLMLLCARCPFGHHQRSNPDVLER